MVQQTAVVLVAPVITSTSFAQVGSGTASQSKDVVRVETDKGVVEGTSEGGIHIFRGIPNAAPPTRDLRWRAPQPVDAWESMRPADRFADRCM